MTPVGHLGLTFLSATGAIAITVIESQPTGLDWKVIVALYLFLGVAILTVREFLKLLK